MQIFRRSLAAFFVLVFVFFSLITFTVYAFNNTFLKPSFYRTALQNNGYDYVINTASKNIYKSDTMISRNFTENDLKRELSIVFTKDVFLTMVDNFAKQIEKLKEKPNDPIVLSLAVFRESLLTLANNLAFKIFQSIPECKDTETPEENVDGLPTCIPKNIEFKMVAAPITEKFEKSIYSIVPEQMQFDLNTTKSGNTISPADFIKGLGIIKYWLYGILIALIVIVAVLIYKPFNLIILYEGLGFFVGGLLGYLLSYGLEGLPKLLMASVNLKGQDAETIQLMNYIISLFGMESQKIAMLFMGFGGVLIVAQMFIKKAKSY